MQCRRLLLSCVVTMSMSSAAYADQSGGVLDEPAPARAPATRLIFGSTARMPAPGAGELVGFEAYGLTVINAGVSPRVSLGVGTSPFSALCLCQPMVLIAPKVQLVNRRRLTMAAGATRLINTGTDVGYRYIVATFGDADTAITVGGGHAYQGDNGRLTLSFGAERRLSPRVVWVTENYLHSKGVLTSGGFRVHGTHWSVDLALAWFLQKDFLIAPTVNVTRSF